MAYDPSNPPQKLPFSDQLGSNTQWPSQGNWDPAYGLSLIHI